MGISIVAITLSWHYLPVCPVFFRIAPLPTTPYGGNPMKSILFAVLSLFAGSAIAADIAGYGALGVVGSRSAMVSGSGVSSGAAIVGISGARAGGAGLTGGVATFGADHLGATSATGAGVVQGSGVTSGALGIAGAQGNAGTVGGSSATSDGVWGALGLGVNP